MARLTLKKARDLNRLADFINQCEADGIGAADPSELDDALSRAIRSPQSEGQTSRFRAPGGSTEK